MFNRNDIRNIAYEKINDRFSRGKYLGVEVTMDMTNGYIHGGHLVGQVKTKGGEPKQFRIWKRSFEAEELIEYLRSDTFVSDPIIEVLDVPNEFKGTYVHPMLVSHLAQWASPIFAHKVAVILNGRVINQAIEDKQRELKIKDDTIYRLEEKINEQSRQIGELLGYARKADEDNEQMMNELETVAVEAKETNDKLEAVQVKLGIAVERRVPRDPVDRRNEIFAIYKKPTANDYKVIRCQYRSFCNSQAKCHEQQYTSQIYFKEDPNAVNIWNRARSGLHTVAAVSGGYFLKINPDKTETDLLQFIKSVEDEKKAV